MPELSSQAQAVLDTYDMSSDGHYDDGVWVPHIREQLAAALRAAVEQCTYRDAWEDKFLSAERILAIANELEAQ